MIQLNSSAHAHQLYHTNSEDTATNANKLFISAKLTISAFHVALILSSIQLNSFVHAINHWDISQIRIQHVFNVFIQNILILTISNVNNVLLA